MEVKTCEQYVLYRLTEAENDVESLQVDLVCKDTQIDNLKHELNSLKEFIRKHSTKATTDEGDNLIRFDNPWEQFEPVDYAYMLSILDEKEDE